MKPAGTGSPSLGLGLGPTWGRGSCCTRAPCPSRAHEPPGDLVEMQLLVEKSRVGPEARRFSGITSAAGPSVAGGLTLWEESLGRCGGSRGGSGQCGQASGLLPRQEKLERVILGSKAAQQHPGEVRGLWQTCGELMFSLEPRLRHLGLGKEVRLPTTREWRASLEASWCHAERERPWALPCTHEAKLLPTSGLSFASCKMKSSSGSMLSGTLGCCVQKEGRREELRAGGSCGGKERRGFRLPVSGRCVG